MIYAQAEGCATLCGKSGTFVTQGLSYRDTDWFDSVGTGTEVTRECVAEFPLQLMFIWGTDCNNLQYDLTTSEECAPATLSRYVAEGAHLWPWVGPQVLSGLDCQADYVLGVCGIAPAPPTPVRPESWGQIKQLYR